MNIKNSIRIAMQCLWIALAIFFVLIVFNSICRPLYLETLNKNIELRIVATGEQNEDALANNVRINHIAVNGKDINLGSVEISDESNWQYDSKNDFLYLYNTEKVDDIVIPLNQVHSLSVTMIQEKGSGIAELYLDEKIWKTIDLYENVDWDEVQFDYDTSFLVFPENNLVLQISLLIIMMIMVFFILRKKKNYDLWFARLVRVPIIGFLSMLTVLLVSIIQYERIHVAFSCIKEQPQSFLKALIFVFLCIQVITLLTDRIWVGFSIVSLLISTGSLVSKIKLLNREIPLLPWDYTMLREAASVAKNYDISVSWSDIAIIVLIVAISVLLFVVRQDSGKKILFRCASGIALAIVIVVYVQSSFIQSDIESDNTDYRVYQINNYYEERGFISAYLEYLVYFDTTEKPDNYNRETLEAICDQIQSEDADKGGNTPNIIAIMSESFWDAERLDTISFDEELLPNYYSLKKESRYGELFSHVFNGGTVVSEFEFLTGFSGEFFPQDYMVYGNFLDAGFDSAVSILEAQGYSTLALHPYLASNYNRETAYLYLGFDESLFEDSFENPKIIRNYISDDELFQRIIEEYKGQKSNHQQPQFIFAVTMQNHGGYWEDTIYDEETVGYSTTQYGDVAQSCIADYMAGLHESDRALGKLIDYFRTVDEDTIIIYFGDHVSNAGPKDDRMLEKTSWVENELEYDFQTHRVPFLIWSNFDHSSEDLGIMEVGELLPTVFEEYGVESNDFWFFLQNLKKYYAATDSKIVVYNSTDYANLADMSEWQSQYYEYYRLLQYDYIWGEKYALNLWK